MPLLQNSFRVLPLFPFHEPVLFLLCAFYLCIYPCPPPSPPPPPPLTAHSYVGPLGKRENCGAQRPNRPCLSSFGEYAAQPISTSLAHSHTYIYIQARHVIPPHQPLGPAWPLCHDPLFQFIAFKPWHLHTIPFSVMVLTQWNHLQLF